MLAQGFLRGVHSKSRIFSLYFKSFFLGLKQYGISFEYLLLPFQYRDS